ncbi:MAG: winged helix-turn-helix domain-containing protein [Lysobacterales bacterium]
MTTSSAFRLGGWQINPRELTLIQGSTRNRLQARSMALLVELHRHLGTVVSKDDLATQVWGVDGASDELIARHISMIRQALEDSARNPQYLETVPRRGYRLVAPPSPAKFSTPTRARRFAFVVPAALIALCALGFFWVVQDNTKPSATNPVLAPRTLAGAQPLLPPGPFRGDIDASANTAKIAFIESTSIDLAGALMVHDLSSGETTRLTGGLNRFPQFSPNGQQIALFRHEDSCQILIVNIDDGGVAHRSNCGGQVASPAAWVSDNQLWFSVDRENGSTLVQWLPDQSEPQTLWHAPSGQQVRFPVVAGRRRFALVRSVNTDQLVEFDTDGRPGETLYGNEPMRARWLSAGPNGDELALVKFDGMDRFGLYEISLALRTVNLIGNRQSVQSADYAYDGRGMFHTVVDHRSHHQVYRYDGAKHIPVNYPSLADTAVTYAQVSPVGDQLIYQETVGTGSALYHLDLISGQAKLLRKAVAGQRFTSSGWTADGKHLLIATAHPFRIHMLEVNSGRSVFHHDVDFPVMSMTLADEKNPLFVVSRQHQELAVYRMDLRSGDAQQLKRTVSGWGQVSADGQRLYRVDQQFRFAVESLTEPGRVTHQITVGSMTGWQVVNQTLLAACPGDPTQAAQLCELDLDSGQTVTDSTLSFYPSHLSRSVDGQWLVLPKVAGLKMDLVLSDWAEPDRLAGSSSKE